MQIATIPHKSIHIIWSTQKPEPNSMRAQFKIERTREGGRERERNAHAHEACVCLMVCSQCCFYFILSSLRYFWSWKKCERAVVGPKSNQKSNFVFVICLNMLSTLHTWNTSKMAKFRWRKKQPSDKWLEWKYYMNLILCVIFRCFFFRFLFCLVNPLYERIS